MLPLLLLWSHGPRASRPQADAVRVPEWLSLAPSLSHSAHISINLCIYILCPSIDRAACLFDPSIELRLVIYLLLFLSCVFILRLNLCCVLFYCIVMYLSVSNNLYQSINLSLYDYNGKLTG